MNNAVRHVDITSRSICEWCLAMEAENERLRSELATLQENFIDARDFKKAKVDVKMVAALHNISEATVRSHITNGDIPKHPDSTDSKYWIQGSVAVSLKPDQLRKHSR